MNIALSKTQLVSTPQSIVGSYDTFLYCEAKLGSQHSDTVAVPLPPP